MGLGVVLGDASAVVVHEAEIVLSFGMALLGGLAPPSHRLGVPQDYVWAYARYDVAASSFPPGKDLDKAVKYRDIVAEKMTPAQIAEAEKLAGEWKPK